MNAIAIIDRLIAASGKLARLERINTITREIEAIGTVCGDCDKWMKSRECPRERNVNGRQLGPSMSASICAEFVESRGAKDNRSRLQSLIEAESTPTSETP